MFTIIRVVLWSIVTVIIITFIKKRAYFAHKRLWIFTELIITMVLMTLSFLIPVENLFITFKSPESVYIYVNSGEVKHVIEGKQTDFVIGQDGDAEVYLIVPKKNDGWKISTGSNTKRVNQKFTDDFMICVYQYGNSKDYYIIIFGTEGGTLEIKDNRDSQFTRLDDYNEILKKNILYLL